LNLFKQSDKEYLFISAKNFQITNLIQKLVEIAKELQTYNSDIIITNLRHFEALKKAEEAIERTINGLNNGISGDFISQDIRECMHFLGEITGEISTDEILRNIFRNFCIGK
jgi:tRNA modification GTPase